MAQIDPEKITDSSTEQQSSTRAERELSALLDVAQAIAVVPSSLELMKRISGMLTRVYEADRTTMYVHDPQKAELWGCVAEGLEHRGVEFRIPEDFGIAGDSFQQRSPAIIPDTMNDNRFNLKAARATGYIPRSMLLMPIKHAGTVCLGVLQIMSETPCFFKREDLRLLNAISIQVGISLSNVQLRERQQMMFDSFVSAMAQTIDSRDPTTGRHSVNVANTAMGIAVHMGMHPSDVKWLWVAGLLHDVGKIGIPENILTKPGRLDDQEYAIMSLHARYSREILSQIHFTDEYDGVDEIAPMHHERLDGQGYPEGLKGGQIPLKARILCVADVFDALTSDRQYRPAMKISQALNILQTMTPDHLDPYCLDGLRRYLGPWGDGRMDG